MKSAHPGVVLLFIASQTLAPGVDASLSSRDQARYEGEAEQPLIDPESAQLDQGGPAQDDALDFGDDAFDLSDDEAFDFGGDDAFDVDEDAADEESVVAEEPPVRFSLRGFVRSDTALWTERMTDEPLAKARQSLDLIATLRWDILRVLASVHGEYDLAYLHRRETYTRQTLETYEYNINTREAQVALSFGEIELTMGRQIVAWGEGDMLSPIDVVNPRDLREPGQADLVDIRLPVLATRLGWFAGDHRLELMWVHENEFGYLSPPGGPYSAFDALLSGSFGGDCVLFDAAALLTDVQLGLGHRQQRFSLEGQEAYARWVYKGPGVDLGLYAASLLDPQGVLTLTAEEVLGYAGASGAIDILLDHPRYHMVGTSGAWAFDAWLLKWEVSLDLRRSVNISRLEPVLPGCDLALPTVSRHEILNLMAGLSWSGVTNLQVGIEVQKPFVLGRLGETLYDVNALNIAMRLSYTTSDDSLSLNSALVMLGDERGFSFTARADVAYQLVEGFKLNVGYVTYLPGPTLSPFTGLDRHDRFLLGFRWDFRVYATASRG